MIKERQALHSLKSVVDGYYKGGYTLTVGNKDNDSIHHVYDVSVIMGIISNHVYEGLGLDIPDRSVKGGE